MKTDGPLGASFRDPSGFLFRHEGRLYRQFVGGIHTEPLAQLSSQTGLKPLRLVVEYLDDLEDIYLAQKRLEDIRAGRSKTIPLEEVMRRYGMEG